MSRPLQPAAIARAFHEACLAELDALKPGNVHRHSADHLAVADFETSALAAAPFVAEPGASVGKRVGLAVEATITAVNQNTNLGIILLAAPLAAAAADPGSGDLRARLGAVLAALSVEDAEEAYRAIRRAQPGGLGVVSLHDVAREPDVTLLEAMRASEESDRIAWNYTHDFADIFDIGLPAFEQGLSHWQEIDAAVAGLYLAFLAGQPDTLIRRKFGAERAAEVQSRARDVQGIFLTKDDWRIVAGELMAFDFRLKAFGLNPGTSADLTVATLFAAKLQALENSH
jgi:triphosphoribosyl-dephospho-CoA synthase